jgi:single-strand DNA-binding protein
MSYHIILIVGNLGRDPEMRYTPSGQAVTNLSVATDSSYTNSQGEKVKRSEWFKVATWGKTAEACNQYLRTGSKVLVEGHMVADEKGNPRSFTRKDGSPGATFEVNASTVRFLSSRSDESGSNGNSNGGHGSNVPQPLGEDIVWTDDESATQIPF